MDFEIESDERVSMAVVQAVSKADGSDPCSLPPLAEELDPDALDVLFEPGPDGSPRSGGHLSFVYADYRVTIDNGEYLTVTPVARMGEITAEQQDERVHGPP